MINVTQVLRRSLFHFHEESMPEDVERYLKALEEAEETLKRKAWDVQKLIPFSEELEKHVTAAVQEEIRYCKFYLNLIERRKTEQLDQWVFTKQEDIKTDGWREPTGEQHVKSNGRIKATIQFDRSKTMVGIEVSFQNDNSILRFMEYDLNNRLSRKSHLKSEESIKARVKEYRQYADEVLRNHQFPEWNMELKSFQILKKILLIEGPEK